MRRFAACFAAYWKIIIRNGRSVTKPQTERKHFRSFTTENLISW